MKQLIPMTRDQSQSVEAALEKIGMQSYLPQFQMIINGKVSPEEVLRLLVEFHNTGFFKGKKHLAEDIKSYIYRLGSKG